MSEVHETPVPAAPTDTAPVSGKRDTLGDPVANGVEATTTGAEPVAAVDEAAGDRPRKKSRFGGQTEEQQLDLAAAAAKARLIADALSQSVGVPTMLKKKIFIDSAAHPGVNFVGLIIGPQGTTHRRLQAESGAKIMVQGRGSQRDPSLEENEELHVAISAENQQQMDKAEQLVNEIINNPNAAKQTQGAAVGVQPGMPQGVVSESFPVPEEYCGAVIGKGGEKIKELQAISRTRASVNNNAPAPPGTKLLECSGTPEAIAHLKSLVNQVCEEKKALAQGNQAGQSGQAPIGGMTGAPAGSSMQVTVPNNMVGLIIGKGGQTIKTMQQATGSMVVIPQQADPDDPTMRTLTINGSCPEAAEACKREIEKVLNPGSVRSVNDGSVVIPNDKAGLIIGRGGSTIKALQAKCQCKVQIPQGPDPGTMPPVRTLVISGQPAGVEMAIAEINGIMRGELRTDQYGNTFPVNQDPYAQWSSQQAQQAQAGGAYGAQAGGAYGAQQQGYGYDQQQQYAQQYAQPQQQYGYGQQAAPQAAAAAPQAGQEQQYTPEQWAAWKKYYEQMGYQIPDNYKPQ